MHSRRLIAGRYRLAEQLGAGGMGMVWRAVDEELGRTVAVKRAITAEGTHQRQHAKLLKREAMAVAQVNHPHVITLFDVVSSDNELWLVMEYLPARTLAQQGLLPAQRVAQIGAQLADALEAVHKAGVLHRDVKPSNVLLTEDRRAKLSDFGVSRTIHNEVTFSRTGGFDGTPGYLAPEVARGEDATPASDVFSLGATLFAALEGVSPVGRADNPQVLVWRAARGDINESHRGGTLAPVLSALMRTDPNRRPDAGEARRMLEAVAKGERPLRRPKVLARTAVLLAVLLVTWGLLSFPTTPDRAAASVQQVARPWLGDPYTADPCALMDPIDLQKFGETELNPENGNFNRCDVLVRPRTGGGEPKGEMEVLLEFEAVPKSGKVPPGQTEQVGDLTIVREPWYGQQPCYRTIVLPERITVALTARFPREAFPVDLCAASEAAMRTALDRLTRGPVPRRPATHGPNSVMNVDVCGLPNAEILSLFPGVDANNPEPGFANWECRWYSTTSKMSLMVRFDQRAPLTASDGQPKRFAGRPAAVKSDGYGDNTCVAYIQAHPYTNRNNRQAIEALLVVTLGDQPSDKLCKVVNDIAEPLAARLPA